MSIELDNIYIHISDDTRWNEVDRTYINGSAYFENMLLTGPKLANIFRGKENLNDYSSLLSKLNGFFAIIHQYKNHILLAADHVRTIPIFYGISQNCVYISDDAYWIKEQMHETEVDEIYTLEFLLTGYVTGSNTLYPKIYQLQAGEIILITQNGERPVFQKRRYYRYIPRDYSKKSDQELLAQLDDVLIRVFHRLTEYADGRMIVIPLSGGYDSRLIAIMLKRLGYMNILCYNYGRVENNESKISKAIAKGLGIKWEFVPYSNEAWAEWCQSQDWKNYRRTAFGLCTLPHIQDWPAIWELKRRELIPEGSIFVPGLSADLLAGSRSKEIPDLYSAYREPENSIENILDYHYNLWDWSRTLKENHQALRDRIISSLNDLSNFPDGASAFESWDVQERQSKYINNSVRVYEYWGYKWWLPFWDLEFMDFWSKVPIQEKINRKLYIKYVEDLFTEVAGSNIEIPSNNRNSIIISFGRKLIKTPVGGQVAMGYNKLKRYGEYEKHPLAWYGLISKGEFKRLHNQSININSFMALKELRDETSSYPKNAQRALSILDANNSILVV